MNTVDVIDPLHGSSAQYHDSLEQFHQANSTGLIDMLYHHLRWKYKVPSEESSWSASLLFVLVHAIRMKYLDRKKNVLVYIMDSSRIDASRVQLAAELLLRYKVAYPPKKLFDAAEYLVHGRLENTNALWKAVALDDLIQAGLCMRLYEENEKGWPKDSWKYVLASINKPSRLKILWQRASELRRPYLLTKTFPMRERLQVCKQVARCFGKEWEAVMLIALLACRRRRAGMVSLKVLMTVLGKDARLPGGLPLFLESGTGSYKGVPECPETYQFVDMLRLAVAYKHVYWTDR